LGFVTTFSISNQVGDVCSEMHFASGFVASTDLTTSIGVVPSVTYHAVPIARSVVVLAVTCAGLDAFPGFLEKIGPSLVGEVRLVVGAAGTADDRPAMEVRF
jgi:hypothetical protein